MLGYTPLSAIDRKITACPQYDKYFDKPKGQLRKKLLDADGGVEDTVKQMMNIVNKHYLEVDKAKHLVKGKTTFETAEKIFDFLFKHIKYNIERGEILNTPAASYYLGQVMARQNPDNTKDYPVDCDDFTIFAASFLKALDLPWAFRIASYDGQKYSHVYCIVPGKKDIIIDPVFYAFNQEKDYKKQKTYKGTSNNLSGMNIHYQGINGLSGIGNPDIQRTMIELSGGVHFDGLGLGNIDDDQDIELQGYLNDTLRVVKAQPGLVRDTYKNPGDFIGMLEKAISGLNTSEEQEILEELTKLENKMIATGKHSLNGIGGNEEFFEDEMFEYDPEELEGVEYIYEGGKRYFAPMSGFFGSLGLFRKLRKKIRSWRTKRLTRKGKTSKLKKVQSRWKKRDTRRVKRKEKVRSFFKKVGKFLNKINPVTVVARNGLRLLLRMNFMNVAGRLVNDENAYKKVLDLFEKMGGKRSAVAKTIAKGAKRKPMFKKEGSVSGLSGMEGFGGLGSIAGAIGAAGGIIKKIISWFKERRAQKKTLKAEGKSGKEIREVFQKERQDRRLERKSDKDRPGFLNRAMNFAQDNFLNNQNPGTNSIPTSYNPQQEINPGNRNAGYTVPVNMNTGGQNMSLMPTSSQKMSMTKKIAIGAGTVLGVGGLVYLLTRNKNKPSVSAHPARLQGVKLK